MLTPIAHSCCQGRLRGRAVALALLGALAVAGCSRGPTTTGSIEPTSVQERHPIVVTNAPVSLDVAVHPSAVGLTSYQRAEVARFLHGYKAGSSGSIVVQTPSGTANETAALGALSEIRAMALGQGISESQIQYRPYGGGGGGFPPIVMVYTGFKALADSCGNWPSDLGKNPSNTPYEDFGCASQRNLAAMVANPRDLIQPRAMDPASAERRDVVRDKYIKGEPTGGKADSDDKGTVSEVAK